MTFSLSIENHARMKKLVWAALALWLAAVFILGAGGFFVVTPDAPPFPILLGATLPLGVFTAAYLGSETFRSLVLAADLRLLTAVQAWPPPVS